MPEEFDKELEIIMRKKLLQLKKMQLLRQLREISEAQKREEDPWKIVEKNLTEKAREVLHYAKMQYPDITEQVVNELARLIKEGAIETPLDAYTLYSIFLSLGVRVTLPTRIRIVKKGEEIDLRKKLREGSE